MAKFEFRFQNVLRHRRNIEQQRQRELAKVLHTRQVGLNHLRDMQETIRDSKRQLGSGLVGKVNLEDISGFARYSAFVAERGRQIVSQLAELDKRINEARSRLIEATKDRRAMELLRDRHYAQWQEEQNRRENIEMDEIATRLFMRGRYREFAE